MALTFAYDRDDPTYPATRQLIFDYFQRELEVNVTVAGQDVMYVYSCSLCKGRPIGTMAYFRAGLGIFDCVADIAKWKFGGLENVGSFLDFASGHGRFTRFLAAAYSKEKIWAAEILDDAVQFQSMRLGVNALQSTTVPEDFEPNRKFDFIYVGSLFTHLPDHTFRRWLQRLFQLLTPTGLLAFSTHGLDHLKQEEVMPEQGIHFIPGSEAPSLNADDYGATVVTGDYVAKAILKATGRRDYRMQHRAVGFNQDLWLVSPGPLPVGQLKYDQGPQGQVDRALWRTPTEIWLSGWAACIHSDHEINHVKVLLNGVSAGNLEVTKDRTDVADHLQNPLKVRCGWNGLVRTHKQVDPWRDVLSVIGVCRGGKESSLRTVCGCSMMQFPEEAMPVPYGSISATAETDLSNKMKAHRALDYALNGEWVKLARNVKHFLNGR